MFELFLEILSKIFAVFALHLSHSNFPKPLSAAEENECFVRLKRGDMAARDKLINHNLRLVAHITKKYYASKMEPDDLISIGTIGLIKAVDSFNADKGARFATYAARCIENEILMTFRALRKEQNTLYMDDPLGTDSDGNAITVADTMRASGDLAAELELRFDSAKLLRALKQLPERERTVAELRFGIGASPLTQQEIADRLGISRSYVSRIETRTVAMLKKSMNERDI